jgi:REP element-mobilizing transposase RayT
VEQWRVDLNWLEGLPADDPREVELRERIAKYEDQGCGACWLRDERLAQLVQNALLHFDGERYRLIAWCVMPNHVHVLLEPGCSLGTAGVSPASCTLESILHSWKSFTAHEANKILGRDGDFWFREYYDRFIRNERHFANAREYIENNPVKAGLVNEKGQWRWSSASSEKSRRDAGAPRAAETAALPGFSHLRYAPYLDYRPLAEGEPGIDALLARPECGWVNRELEQKAQGYAVAQVVPEHLTEVRSRRLDLIAKTEAAVQDRLTKEISYWDHRAEQLKLQEQAGRTNARLNSDEARKRADGLQGRLQKRMEELKLEKQIAPLPPVVIGGLLVVPAGLLAAMKGEPTGRTTAIPQDTQVSAAKARAIIMQAERELGFVPTDRETEKLGYDIESRIPGTGKLRFIEVKGRVSGAPTITVTKNEILYSLNKPDDFILAIVEFDGDAHRSHYVRRPFQREPDFGVTSVNYNFAELLQRAEVPR